MRQDLPSSHLPIIPASLLEGQSRIPSHLPTSETVNSCSIYLLFQKRNSYSCFFISYYSTTVFTLSVYLMRKKTVGPILIKNRRYVCGQNLQKDIEENRIFLTVLFQNYIIQEVGDKMEEVSARPTYSNLNGSSYNETVYF